jgi:hypothetical protein
MRHPDESPSVAPDAVILPPTESVDITDAMPTE